MRKLQFLCWTSCVVGAISGCLSNADEAETGDGITDRRHATTVIDYLEHAQRAYAHATVHIESDGTMDRRFPNGKETHSQLDRAELRELQRKIDEADVPSLDRRYGCYGCADGLTQVITVQLHGDTYETDTDRRFLLPERAVPLFDALHELVNDPDEQRR
jgi:hypothetical protein